MTPYFGHMILFGSHWVRRPSDGEPFSAAAKLSTLVVSAADAIS